MNYKDIYSSDFLKADDIPQGQRVPIRIKDVELTTIENKRTPGKIDRQLVLHFHGTRKKLGLNKTNADTIAELYGDDTSFWIHQTIEVYATTTKAYGETHHTVRIIGREPVGPPPLSARAPAPAFNSAPAAAPVFAGAPDLGYDHNAGGDSWAPPGPAAPPPPPPPEDRGPMPPSNHGFPPIDQSQPRQPMGGGLVDSSPDFDDDIPF